MRRRSTGQIADRTGKTVSAATIDTHIRAVEAAEGMLTPEQVGRLHALLPPPANTVRQTSHMYLVGARVFVTAAVLGLAWFMVVRLSRTNPALIAPALAAFAAVVATIPPIIKALR
jgi:hypothetical protein